MERRRVGWFFTLFSAFFVCCCLVCATHESLAAPDPSIQDWGSPPGSPPPWQTSDVYVDNDGDNLHNEGEDIAGGLAAEPSKGLKNRLFARIANLGSSAANGITVRFSYAPYGAWSPASFSDFKQIAVLTGVSLGAAGASDAAKLLEVEWDLTNLAEDNGGSWGGYTVGDFTHFCVLVQLEMEGDSNTANNKAQNNFTNVVTVAAKTSTMKFLVCNPERKTANAALIIKGFPEDWKYEVGGVKDHRRFVLGPKEYKLITLAFTPPRQPKAETPVDISLELNKKIVGGISFNAIGGSPAPSAFTPSGGVLSPYIVGTFDLRENARTVLHIINPTARHLKVMAAFFDDQEKPLKCISEKLTPNDLWEIDVLKLEPGARFGVVKVFSLNPREKVPEIGIVGYQRHFFEKMGVTESLMHPVPGEILKDDLKYIWKICE